MLPDAQAAPALVPLPSPPPPPLTTAPRVPRPTAPSFTRFTFSTFASGAKPSRYNACSPTVMCRAHTKPLWVTLVEMELLILSTFRLKNCLRPFPSPRYDWPLPQTVLESITYNGTWDPFCQLCPVHSPLCGALLPPPPLCCLCPAGSQLLMTAVFVLVVVYLYA
jgi:hypothetical protein